MVAVSLHRIGTGGVTRPYYEPGSFQLALIHAVDFGLVDEENVASFCVCGECYRTGRGYHIPRYEKLDQGGRHVCPNCGFVVSLHFEMGELDLGLFRDATNERENDFRLFTQTF